MKTYSQIKAEIAKLEKQANAARQAEIAGVVGRIKEAIAAYGLTAADLGFGNRGTGKSATSRKSANGLQRKSVGVAKYQDPATGKTWTGMGRPPDWIVDARNRDDFLIAGARAQSAGKRGGRKGAKAAGAKRRPARKQGARAGRNAGTAAQSASVQIESGAASQ